MTNPKADWMERTLLFSELIRYSEVKNQILHVCLLHTDSRDNLLVFITGNFGTRYHNIKQYTLYGSYGSSLPASFPCKDYSTCILMCDDKLQIVNTWKKSDMGWLDWLYLANRRVRGSPSQPLQRSNPVSDLTHAQYVLIYYNPRVAQNRLTHSTKLWLRRLQRLLRVVAWRNWRCWSLVIASEQYSSSWEYGASDQKQQMSGLIR